MREGENGRRPKLLVVLGAGASFDSRLEGEFRGDGTTPPLTKDLFTSQYTETLKRYPGAYSLRSTIMQRIAGGKTTLEQVLTQLSLQPDENIRAQVAEIPVYLRDLIGGVTSDSTPGVYDALIHLLQEQHFDVFFATLNYDTLLEEAIERKYTLNGQIAGFDDYVQNGREWQLAKIHGSVNWMHRTGHVFRESTANHLYNDYLPAIRTHLPRKDLFFVPNHVDLYDNEELLAPALAVPTEAKYGIICPDPHQEALRNFAAQNPHTLVIGNQGLDSSLMDLLNVAFPQASGPARLTVVDPSEEHGEEILARFRAAVHVEASQAVPSTFSKFVADDQAIRLISNLAGA